MSKLLAGSMVAVLTAASTYSIFTWQHISPINVRRVTSTKTVSDSFRNSKCVKTVVNPKDHITLNSSRSITVKVPSDTTDEILLARFTKGFFGGYVLGPERTVLSALRLDLVRYEQRLGQLNTSPPIWSASQLSEQSPPPLLSKLFGVFQVVDCRIEQERSTTAKTHSYIDFAFGSDTGYIAGVHRFSVWRDVNSKDGMVMIEHSDMVFNPIVDRLLGPDVLFQFHLIYAMALFREGVLHVVR